MPTAVLDKLLLTQWGKVFIFWVFIGLCAIVACLGWYVFQQAKEIRECNHERIESEKGFSLERERIIREQTTFYQSMLARIQAVEEKRKKR
jgi:hypothetical protein